MKNEGLTITCSVRSGKDGGVPAEDAETIRDRIAGVLPGAVVDLRVSPPRDDGTEDLIIGLPRDLHRSIRRAASAPGVRQSIDDWISTACKLRLQRDKHIMPRSTDPDEWEEDWDEWEDRKRGGRREEE